MSKESRAVSPIGGVGELFKTLSDAEKAAIADRAAAAKGLTVAQMFEVAKQGKLPVATETPEQQATRVLKATQ